MANHTETIPLETLMDPILTKNSITVLEKRYLKKDLESRKPIENPKQMFWRVAQNIAQADRLYDPDANSLELAKKFYEMMVKLEFLPNSPTLMNAGRELQQLSACFVLPVEDDLAAIFDAVKRAALIHQSGGGTGFSFSRLRPNQDPILTVPGVASGPVSFMSVFNRATEVIKQGGTRRGANMGILRIDHPDSIEFIKCKSETTKFNNFNISIAITDKFMKAVETGEDFELVNPRNNKVVKKINARETFDLIVDKAWSNGEPGMVFLDVINKVNPTPEIGEIESTNPCGEQPLLPYESCNLGSINLSKFVKDRRIEWDRLKETIHLATHFLDNVVDMNKFPLPEIEKMTNANRKIGLGVMGWADMLIQLNISYNSEEAFSLGEKVMSFIANESKLADLQREVNIKRNIAKDLDKFKEELGKIFEEVKNAAYRIIEYKGATYYAIALALVRIAGAILRDENSVLPVSSLIHDYYGVSDVCLSLPSIVNRKGIVKVLSLELSSEEQKQLKHSAQTLKDIIGKLKI